MSFAAPIKPDRAFILCAGLGTRLRPYTDTLPKPMVPVDGVPLLGHALDRVYAAGVRHVVLNTHYRPESIEAYIKTRTDLQIDRLHEDALLDTGGGVKAALPLLGKNPFYVINGDALWEDDPVGSGSVLRDLAQHFDPARMDLLLGLAPVTTHGTGDYAGTDDGRCVRTADKSGEYVFSGIRLAAPALFDESPAGAFSFLWLMDRAQTRGKLYGRALKGRWHHISTPDDVHRANDIWAQCRAHHRAQGPL